MVFFKGERVGWKVKSPLGIVLNKLQCLRKPNQKPIPIKDGSVSLSEIVRVCKNKIAKDLVFSMYVSELAVKEIYFILCI